MKLKLLDLFSGIGGFSLGLESTGYFKTIAFVEKDKFCQQVLQKNFKDTPIESEVRNVKGERYAADIITGGFPCQPFSVAGKRRGTDDDRYLWDETIRIIRECKPRWFIGENVEGIINIQGGMVLRQVQDDLEKEGFQVQCLVIPASGIGAWHQRKRVWIIAHSNSNRDRYEIKGSNGEEKEIQREYREKDNTTGKPFRADTNVPNSNSRLSIGENEEVQARRNTINDGSKNVSNTDSGMRGRWGTEQSSGANQEWRFCIEKEKQTQHDIRSKAVGCDAIHGEDVLNSNSIGLQRRSIQSNNLQETSNSTETTNTSSKEQYTWWKAQSSLCGVPNGISYELDKSRSNRIKSLGNSIVPLIARELGIAIMKAEQDG
jgi:DNA (cytosine-5)-methyltransferase 1